MVRMSVPVKNDFLYFGGLSGLRNRGTDSGDFLVHGTLSGLVANSSGVGQGVMFRVIDNLGGNVQVAHEYGQARTLGGANNCGAHAALAQDFILGLMGLCTHGYLSLPLFPALRTMRSS